MADSIPIPILLNSEDSHWRYGSTQQIHLSKDARLNKQVTVERGRRQMKKDITWCKPQVYILTNNISLRGWKIGIWLKRNIFTFFLSTVTDCSRCLCFSPGTWFCSLAEWNINILELLLLAFLVIFIITD